MNNEEPMGDDGQRRGLSRRGFLKASAIGAGIAATDLKIFEQFASAATNPITTENALTGNPPSEWQTLQDTSIEGFTTNFSVNKGSPVQFKVRTPAKQYSITIYRLGWYGGNGARKIATVMPSVTLPQSQPAPLTDPSTGLIDCGNWAVSATWNVPSTAVSGVYYALFQRLDSTQDSSYTLFVVRDDARTADVLLQTSDTTMHAYNDWGGNSLYTGNPAGRAYKVSYNRPFNSYGPDTSFWSGGYPLIRFLERNGYDVKYTSGVDVDRSGITALPKPKVYISSDHDEYWSKQQRANVEAARAAGINLCFFSGNEVFWKTRWETSIDASHTPYRTLVCYKETAAGAKIDPSPEWTGTWRDPRFSPPADGGRPENALTGQLFRAQAGNLALTDLAIQVPYPLSRLRLWRNTSVAQITAGQTATLSAGMIGYEWDQDEDNGFRPAGLVRFSQTQTNAPQKLTDYGTTYSSGPVTHSLTMYRAPSGALVFAAGTIQFAWGLDNSHTTSTDPETAPTSTAVQQAVVNLLADMNVQPATRMAGLVAASGSTDTIPPTSTITSPTTGTTVQVGRLTTIAGTANDTGGGIVAGVEVSTDGGATWHPATGTTSWSYSWLPLTQGTVTVKSRAVDDSCNIENPSAGITVTVGPRSTPTPIWGDAFVPTTPATTDANAVEVGVKFQADSDGFISGVRFYKGPGNTGTHVGRLWDASGNKLGEVTFTNETASGWQTATFPTQIRIRGGTTYVASCYCPAGHYAADSGYFANAFVLAPLRALSNGESGGNGVYVYGKAFPTNSFGAANYWVDVVYTLNDPAPPSVVDVSPAPGVGAVATNTTVRASFSEQMNGSSIVLKVTDPSGAVVPGSLSFTTANNSITFTPTSALANRTTYTATVSSASDSTGQAMTAPYSWQFTTVSVAGSLPASLWDSSVTPVNVAVNDAHEVEVGTRFTTDRDGQINAIRFYKAPGSAGPHVGHLWDAAGNLLATQIFNNETQSGWQQVALSNPVQVQRNKAYIVSVHCPAGTYPSTAGLFNSVYNATPLHGPASATGSLNGVYLYGPAGFPVNSFGNTSYFVDVVFDATVSTAVPHVTETTPVASLYGVDPASAMTATFDVDLNPTSLTFTVTPQGGSSVPGTVAYDVINRIATFTPSSPLAAGTLHTASVRASSSGGTAMASPFTWTFTTVASPGNTPTVLWTTATVPATLDSGDTNSVEVGVKVQVDRPAAIAGVRFYKVAANVGPHTVSLWAPNGTLLATANVTNESTQGWQQGLFSSPVNVMPGNTYTASYHAPGGHYSATAGALSSSVDASPVHAPASGSVGGNGVYAYSTNAMPTSSFNSTSYLVDVVCIDPTGPMVVGRSPAAGATGVPVSSVVSATFNVAVQPGSISFALRDSNGALVPATTSYDGTTQTAVLTPSAPLAGNSPYTATVSNALDSAGHAMAAPDSWSFSTGAAPPPGSVQLFDDAYVPSTPSVNDSGPLTVGMVFTADVVGDVLGVRFYKGSGNTGTHVGGLWDTAGNQLASVTFTNETASGWQYAAFSSPVRIAAATQYVVSYFAPAGHYSSDAALFTSSLDRGVLHAPASNNAGGNGRYHYAATHSFPDGSFNATSYGVDVVFRPAS